jgi:hypothetical protein
MHSWNNVIERPRLLYLGFGTTFHIIWGLAYTNKRNAVHFTRLTNKLLSEGFFMLLKRSLFFFGAFTAVCSSIAEAFSRG